MQRTRTNKKPSAILCSDIHLREDIPVCRTDDYWSAQWRKMDFISGLQKKWNIPVLCGGDVFHHWKISPYLITETMKHLPAKFYSCMGQHDLPQHLISLAYKSGFATLVESENIKLFPEWNFNVQICHYGQEPIKMDGRTKNILIWHKLAFKGAPPYPGAPHSGQSSDILRKHPDVDLFLMGDNHQTFTSTYGNQLLVNPGSMMRMTADQIDHKPCVFLWYAQDNTVEQVFLPIEQGVVSREHIDKVEQRDGRIEAFISRLDKEYEVGMSFEQNLEVFLAENNVRDSVKQIIYQAIE
jgi:DNA repair exonuclease SbcCD nuclease subunit